VGQERPLRWIGDRPQVVALRRVRELGASLQRIGLPILSRYSSKIRSVIGEAWRAAKPHAEGRPDPAAGREPMDEWRSVVRRTFITIGVFSAFVNLLMLTMPIYLFQISDRVLTSRSMDTLVMLSLLALGLIVVLSLLDTLRRQVLGRLATRMETILGGPVLASIITTAPASDGGNVQPLRSLHQMRGFIASPTMLTLFDAPMAPLYFAAIFLIHRDLGLIVLGSGIALVAIALLNQRATSGPLVEAGRYGSKADAQADALARNAQVINAMGMLDEGILQWGREQANALTTQTAALDRSFTRARLAVFFSVRVCRSCARDRLVARVRAPRRRQCRGRDGRRDRLHGGPRARQPSDRRPHPGHRAPLAPLCAAGTGSRRVRGSFRLLAGGRPDGCRWRGDAGRTRR
jgi:ATP-binding cassette subfamily C protein